MTYRFWLQTDVRVGPDASFLAADYIFENKIKNVVLIVDHGIKSNKQYQRFLRKLRQTKAKIQIEYVAVTEANYDFLEKFRGRFTGKIDLFIGLGGGSVLDITKAMSVLIVNKKKALAYRGFGKIKRKGPPVIAIPTTAGTGSEITPNASFIDAKEMKKMGINTNLYLPALAILDPLLTLSCPVSVTVGAGMDSVIHALEGYTAKIATPLAQIFSREALRILLRDLPKVIKSPRNVAIRQNLQIGALLAGVAMINSSGSLTAALSYPLGVRFKVPHGMAGAVYLAKVLRMNYNHGTTVYSELADLLPVPPKAGSARVRAEAFVNYLGKMSKQLKVPEKISAFGVTKKDLPVLTDELFTFTGALAQNPVSVSREMIGGLMEEML